MRAIWSGAISFGLVSIPVKLYPATETHGIGSHQLHKKDHARIHNERVCAKGHKDIDYDQVEFGYEYEKGRYVVLTDEERESLRVRSTKTIDVTQFVDADEIPALYALKAYYATPEKGGAKAYRLMNRALAEEGKIALGKLTLRDRERPAAVRPQDDRLVIEVMHWPDEIREAPDTGEQTRTSSKELEMARSLIKGLSAAFDPSDFRDEYDRALTKLIEKKAKGEDIEVVEEPEETADVADLMEALRRSVESVQHRRTSKRKKAG